MNNRIIKTLFVFLLAFEFAYLNSNPIKVNETRNSYFLYNDIQILEDQENDLTINEVIELDSSFTKNKSKSLNFGYSKSSYWLKFDILNQEHSAINLIYSIKFPSLNHVSFYAIKGDSLVKSTITGQSYKYNSRDVFHRDFLFSLNLLPQEKYTVYTRVYNDGDSMYLPLELSKTDFHNKTDFYYLILWGIYFGIILFLTVFNVFYVITLKEKVYLYYFLYVFAGLVFFSSLDGLLQQLISPNQLWWNERSMMFSLTIVFYSLINFTQGFLATKQWVPIWHKILSVYKLLMIPIFFLALTNYPLLIIPNVAITIIAPVSFALVLFTSLLLISKGQKTSVYFVFAFSITFFGVVIHALRDFGVVTDSIFTENALKTCFLTEVIILFFAVLDRIKRIQKDAHDKLQLQNTQIQLQSNELRMANFELKKLSFVASRANNSIGIFDKEGDIEWCNDRFQDIHRLQCEEVKHHITGNIIKIFEHPDINNFQERCFHNKETIIFENQVPGPNNMNVFTQTTITPLVDDAGEIEKLISVESDITELKQTQADLIAAKNKAEESDKLKSAFIANMSHEIRTPMNAIIGFSKLIKRDSLPKQKKEEYIQIIDSSSRELLRLIDDILDISKMEAGQLQIFFDTIILDDLVKDISTQMEFERKRLERMNVDLILDTPKDQKLLIIADEERLKQVLTNLLNNAFKFTEKGSVTFGYRLNDNENILFYVKDTGTGIEPRYKEQIFNRFFKVEESNEKLYRGTGLGLTISSNLVYLMEGKIWMESELNKGTVFYFTIPLKKGNPKKLEELKKAGKTLDPAKYKWKGKNILVAEDNEDNFKLIKEMLEPTNAGVQWVKNGMEVLETLDDQKHDLIIMDIQMPEMNGYEATKKIRQTGTKVKIIALTAFAQPAEKGRAVKNGCDDYLPKPVDPNAFFETLARYL